MAYRRHPELRRQRLRQIGRFGAALAAGGAFAALSWNPSSNNKTDPKSRETTDDSSTAVRASVVTEDDAWPQFNAAVPTIGGCDQWAVVRPQDRASLTPYANGPESVGATSTRMRSPTDVKERITTMMTAVPHSRGPPLDERMGGLSGRAATRRGSEPF